MSRGLWVYMGARTRRSLALLWAAMFMASLLLQYLSFAAPTRVLAHEASDFFVYSRAEYGKFAEANCDGSNDAQASFSGSGNEIFGRVHSNADFAAGGSGLVFNGAVTYGTNDEDCQNQPELVNNTYNAGNPTDVDAVPSGVVDGWPGDLDSYLDANGLTFGTDITQILGVGAACDVGSLTNASDITVNPVTNDGDVVCNGSGKVTLSIQNATMSLTIVSHGRIDISAQSATITPAVHNILAWTDQDSNDSDISIALSGSDLQITERAIFFTPRSGQDISGSDDSELCIQNIGQGIIKVQGSNSAFGPDLCDEPARNPDLDVTKLVKTNDGAFGPTSTAQPGDVLTFQITVSNTGDSAATNVPVSDDITDLLAHATYNADCSDSCSFNAANDVLSWMIPSLAADGGTEVLTFSVTLDADFPAGTTNLPNVVVVTESGSNCLPPSEDPDCDTNTTVEVEPAVDVTKLVKTNNGAFGPTSTAEPGDVLTFQISISNNGDAAATNVPVSDDITDLLAHATYNADCSDSCSFNAATDVLSWTIASIAPGGTEVLTFSVTLDADFPAGTTNLPNVVVVTAPGSNCAETSEDPDCDTNTTVEVEPGLTVTKLVRTLPSGVFAGTNAAEPGDVVQFQITVTNGGDAAIANVPVSDDITDLLAHATYNADCSDTCSFNAATDVLSWTIPTLAANGGSETLTFSVTLDASFPGGQTVLPNIVVVTGPGSNCPQGEGDDDCDTTTTVTTDPLLTILKSFTGNTGGTGPGGVPEAREGDVLTYTLTYDLTNGPVTNGVITDVLPVGLAYVAGSASNTGTPFSFVGFNAGTRTLTWTAPTVVADGTVSYQVQVLVDASELEQPLENVATIDSTQTAPDDDDAVVFVEVPPQTATSTPNVTLPPTSTLDQPRHGTSNPGFSLMLVLLGLAGFALAIGFVTPVPERARRSDRR